MFDKTNYYLQSMGMTPWVIREKKARNDLNSLSQEVSACTRCVLHKTRSNTVFSRGNPHAKLMLIGEAPGFYEDKQGLPFVGKAGLLLNQMLSSIDLSEDEVYIANVIKCRPPNNRDPSEEEIATCSPFLEKQIELINPNVILALGRFAGQFLLQKNIPMQQMRNTMHQYKNCSFYVTYHPAYLLRKPTDKRKAYADLLFVKQFLSGLSC